MAALDFPASPTNGQTYVGDNGVTYRWDTVKWVVEAADLTAAHTHLISDITGLQTALDGKAASSHTHTVSDITDINTVTFPTPQAYSAAGNGTTNDTTAFTNLEADFTDAIVDLRGKIYLVNAIPTGNTYINGGFKLSDGLVYPMDMTFRHNKGVVARGTAQYIKFQGGGYSYNGRIGLFYGNGDDDNSLTEIRHSYSFDGGLNWRSQNEFGTTETGFPTHAVHANIIWNNRFGILFKGDNADDYLYYHKPVPRYEVKYIDVDTSIGDATIVFNWPSHGLRNGDTIQITKFANTSTTSGAVVGGVQYSNVSGAGKTVTKIDEDSFSVEMNSGTASSTDSKNLFVGIRFENQAWGEHTYTGSTNWEDRAVSQLTASGLTSITLVQGWARTTDGYLLIPVSGNKKCIIRSPNPSGSVTGTSLWQLRADFSLGTGNNLTEPTIAYERDANGDPTGDMCGFLRTQNPTTQKAQFWWSDDNCNTFEQSNIKLAIGNRSPIPCEFGDDGKIYGFMTERLTDNTGDSEFGAIYLLVADKADAFDTGAGKGGDAFEIYKIGEAWISAYAGNDLNPSNEASNVGRPTAVKHGSWIFFFYEEEEQGDMSLDSTQNLVVNIKYFAINTDPQKKMFPLTQRGAW